MLANSQGCRVLVVHDTLSKYLTARHLQVQETAHAVRVKRCVDSFGMTLTDLRRGQPCGRRTAFPKEHFSLRLGRRSSISVFVKVQILRVIQHNGTKDFSRGRIEKFPPSRVWQMKATENFRDDARACPLKNSRCVMLAD